VKVPIVLKIALLTVAATAFYTYVGQLVPQKEVQPPVETKLASTMSTADLVATGKTIVEGKGTCLTCHTIGKTSGPYRFPDLAGVGDRAKHREPGFTDIDYFAQAVYHPNDFIVPGFNPGMPTINKPPIGLTDDEIRAVIAYLQSLGGTPTMTMTTVIPYSAAVGGAGPGSPQVLAAQKGGAGGAAAASGGAPASGGAASAPANVESATASAAAAGAGNAVASTASGGTATAPVATASAHDAQSLVTTYQCASCHKLDAPGKLKAASLVDIGARKNEPQIVAALAAHPAMPAGFDQASLADVRALARFLAAKKGGGA